MSRARVLVGLVLASLSLSTGCALVPLSGQALRQVHRPVFISRIEENAGPRSTVFRDDAGSYREKLKSLDSKEADRRLSLKLAQGTKEIPSMTRFELAGTLRAEVLALVSSDRPWSDVVNPEEVARVLESYLVEEVPANPPDYARLKELEADSVMEIVIEEYGMRSARGRAGLALKGYAMLFKIDGPQLYRRSFFSDELAAGLPHLDPFSVAKNPSLYRDRMRSVLQAVATTIAADLVPSGGSDISAAPEAGPTGGGDVVAPRRLKKQVQPEDDPL